MCTSGYAVDNTAIATVVPFLQIAWHTNHTSSLLHGSSGLELHSISPVSSGYSGHEFTVSSILDKMSVRLNMSANHELPSSYSSITGKVRRPEQCELCLAVRAFSEHVLMSPKPRLCPEHWLLEPPFTLAQGNTYHDAWHSVVPTPD